MWLANFEDGTAITSKTTFWTQLNKEKKLTGLQLKHPMVPNLFLNLKALDAYYFAQEAMASPQFEDPSKPVVLAEIIGGHDLLLKVGIEIRLDMRGSVKVTPYALESFRYSPQILVPGFRPTTID